MAYVALADISGAFAATFLTQALDDDNDGEIDAWDAVAADAQSAIDGILGGRFEVPFTGDLPPTVKEAARISACYQLYQRRGVHDDANPWTSRYTTYFGSNGLLSKIAQGKAPLAPEVNRAKPSGTLIGETSKTHDTGGRRMA